MATYAANTTSATMLAASLGAASIWTAVVSAGGRWSDPATNRCRGSVGGAAVLIDEQPDHGVVSKCAARAAASRMTSALPPACDHDAIQEKVQGKRGDDAMHEDVEPRGARLGYRCLGTPGREHRVFQIHQRPQVGRGRHLEQLGQPLLHALAHRGIRRADRE